MTARVLLPAALGILAACWLLRGPLERDPVTHVLVQLPLLGSAGVLAASALPVPRPRGPWANALVLAALAAILFWMLPRWIDAALAAPFWEAAKFASLPVLAGAPLALGWGGAHPFLRGAVKANALSMLGVLAFLYTHAPIRICNSYLVADQERLGVGFLAAAFGLALAWALPLFLPAAARPA